ncbi:MAG: hypothetical protein ABFD60_00355 [Bryobacteraceae bacterium]
MFSRLLSDRWEELLLRIAVAIEAGVLAGIISLAWLVLNTILAGEPAWSVPVALATWFSEEDGNRAFVGAAVHVCASGVAGCVFALLVRHVFRLERAVVLGILAGLAVFAVGHLPLAFSRQVLETEPVPAWSRLVACLLFGAVLGCYPHLLRTATGEKTP